MTTSSPKNLRCLGLAISLLIILLDQSSKWAITHHLNFGEPWPITSWLNLTLSYNTGIAFGFLSSATTIKPNDWLLLMTSVIIIGLFIGLWRLKAQESYLAISLGFIIGGAFGNLIDRLRLGYVVDFIDYHWHTWHYATFNLADSAISIGAVLLIGWTLLHRNA